MDNRRQDTQRSLSNGSAPTSWTRHSSESPTTRTTCSRSLRNALSLASTKEASAMDWLQHFLQSVSSSYDYTTITKEPMLLSQAGKKTGNQPTSCSLQFKRALGGGPGEGGMGMIPSHDLLQLTDSFFFFLSLHRDSTTSSHQDRICLSRSDYIFLHTTHPANTF